MYCHTKIVVFQLKCNIMWIVLHFTILKKLCVYLGNLAYNFNFLFIGLLLNSSYIQLLVDITPCTYVKDIYKEFVPYNTKNSPVATYSQSEDIVVGLWIELLHIIGFNIPIILRHFFKRFKKPKTYHLVFLDEFFSRLWILNLVKVHLS